MGAISGGKKAVDFVLTELAERAKSGDGLAMDFTSRMDRAKAQGFDTSQQYLHGASKGGYNETADISAFDPEKIGDKWGQDREGFFFTNDPNEANYYASTDTVGNNVTGGAVYPTYQRSENPLVIDSASDLDLAGEGGTAYWDTRYKDILEQAKKGGHDSVKLIDRGPYEDQMSEMVVALDPSNIRSVNAAFDPAKKESSNLLASTIPAAVGLGALTQGEEAEAGGVSKGVAALHDLLQPMGKSRMVGDEKLVMDTPELKVFEADPHYTSQGQGKSYRYVKYEDGNPVSTLQFGTKGPRSKKATIQNIHTDENSRRSGHAKDLLDRARQDFDIKHSDDLTNDGRAWSKAVPAIGTVGAGTAAATYTPEQNKAYAQSIISNEPPRTQGEQQWRSEMQGANMKLEDYMGLATGAVVGALETVGDITGLIGDNLDVYSGGMYDYGDKFKSPFKSYADRLRKAATDKGALPASVDSGTFLSPL
jgi:hypothetical protein